MVIAIARLPLRSTGPIGAGVRGDGFESGWRWGEGTTELAAEPNITLGLMGTGVRTGTLPRDPKVRVDGGDFRISAVLCTSASEAGRLMSDEGRSVTLCLSGAGTI